MSETQFIEQAQDPNRVLAVEDKQLTVPDLYMVIQEPYDSSKLRERTIGFNAKSVVINNLSGQWFYAPFLATWIPPFIIGMTKNIPGGTQKASVIAETPVGQTSSPTAGQYVTLNFYSLNLSPDPGIIIGNVGGGSVSALAEGQYNGTLPVLADGAIAPLQLGSRGSQRVEIFGASSNANVGVYSTNSDNVNGQSALNVAASTYVLGVTGLWQRARDVVGVGVDAAAGTGIQAQGNFAFNSTTWDRVYNNFRTGLLSPAARTASVATPDQVNRNGKGVRVFIDVTAIVASPSMVATIQAKDEVSGQYVDLLSSVPIVAVGITMLTIYPGITPAANVSLSQVLSRGWRVNLVNADADSITYSVTSETLL